jgi:hypothetical protein
MGDHVTISVYFHKSNTFLGFKTDSKVYGWCKDKTITVNTYKDLRNSLFASSFLDIKDLKSDNLDIRCQFSNILKEYNDHIQYICNESIKLSKITTENGTFDNLLYLYGFTFTNYQGDFIYLLAERQHIDVTISKKLVRTSAIQLSTTECGTNMIKMVEHSRGEDYVNNSNFSMTTDDLTDLFDKPDVKVTRL